MEKVNKSDYIIHTHDYFDLNYYSIQNKFTGQIVYGGDLSFSLAQCESKYETWDGTLINSEIL